MINLVKIKSIIKDTKNKTIFLLLFQETNKILIKYILKNEYYILLNRFLIVFSSSKNDYWLKVKEGINVRCAC